MEHHNSKSRQLKKLLEEVKADRKQLADIFDMAPSFMCILRGPDHVFERANKQYCQLVGNRNILGKSVREALPDIGGQGFYDILDRVYETGEAYIGKDIKIRMRGSKSPEKLEEHWLNFVYQPIRNANNTVTGIFVQGVDLTQRKEAEIALRSINQTLEERVEERTSTLLTYQNQLRSLVSQISKAEEYQRQRLASELHDNLGQILAMGKMEIDLMKDFSDQSAPDLEKLRELINEAIRYTRELMLELKPPPVLDKDDIKSGIQWVADKMKKQGLEVTIEDDDQSKPINEEVQAVIFHSVNELLMNIVRHSGVKEARISLARLGEQMQIIVEDEGQGFKLNKNEFTPSEEGGFGLFNIQERINILGGSLKLDSAPQEGTKATLVFPLQIDERSEVTVSDHEKKEESPIRKKRSEDENKKITILIADDHEMVRKGLKNLIEQEDDLIIIAEASNGVEAVKLTGELLPDVVVMDINMPHMDGIEATRMISTDLPEVCIIGLSLHTQEHVSQEMKHAGASAYLSKTEAFETLCETIRHEIFLEDVSL